MMQQTQIK